MADLETILDSQDTTENKNTLSHNVSDNGVKSPSRKENILPPPLPPIPTILINNGNVFPFNKSFNAGLLNFKKRYNSQRKVRTSDFLRSRNDDITERNSLLFCSKKFKEKK